MSDEINTPIDTQITNQENPTPEVINPEVVIEPVIAIEPVITTPPVADEPVIIPTEPASTESTPKPTTEIKIEEPVSEIPLENKTEEVTTPTEVATEPVVITPPIVESEPTVATPIEPTPIETTPEPINEDKIIRSFLLKILDKAKIATQSRNKKRMETLLTFFDTNSHVTNNMVEKLLKISDSSARNYLNKLEKQGKIIQHGNVGRGVFYTKA